MTGARPTAPDPDHDDDSVVVERVNEAGADVEIEGEARYELDPDWHPPAPG